MPEKAMLVMTTVDRVELAEAIAAALLEKRLAACVQEMRIGSRYRWEGRLRRDEEILLLVKTSVAAAGAAMGAIRELHSYDVPEILALPVTDGLCAYLEWIDAEADGRS